MAHKNKQSLKRTPKQKNFGQRMKLALVPCRGNDYQPLLVRRYGLAAAMVLVIGAQILYNVSETGSVLGERANVSIGALVDETNKSRSENGLDEVAVNQKLNYAAYMKASDMFEKQYWGHTAPDGTEPWKWLVEADYAYSKAGENLAKNFYTAEAATVAWMSSPEHRKNILEPDFTEAGFAVASGELNGEKTTIVVALYGRPTSAGVVSPGALVAGAQGGSMSLVTRLGVGMQSVTPAALGSIVVLTLLMMVSFAAHLYRDFIPVSHSHPRHRHNHGAIKMSLMFALILAMLALYGGGQI